MKMKWWLKDLMICTHENFLYNTGNVNRSYQSRVLLYCDWNLPRCAPSGFRVHLLEPAPRELKARKTPSKIKLKIKTLKTRKVLLHCTSESHVKFDSSVPRGRSIRRNTWTIRKKFQEQPEWTSESRELHYSETWHHRQVCLLLFLTSFLDFVEAYIGIRLKLTLNYMSIYRRMP
jgi:hypothetical protein